LNFKFQGQTYKVQKYGGVCFFNIIKSFMGITYGDNNLYLNVVLHKVHGTWVT